MNWLRNITRSGLSDSDEYQQKRGILLSNYISLTLGTCLLLLFIVRHFIFGHIPGGLSINYLVLGLIVFLTPILCNKMGLTTISRLFLCYSPVCFIWYVYVSTMKPMPVIEQAVYDSERIFLLALSFIPYMLLEWKKPHLLLVGVLPTLISLLFFESILKWFGEGIDQRGLPGSEYTLMGIRTFVAYCILSISCFLFQSIISYNDELNKKILSQLKLKSLELETQNMKLVQSQDRLNEINLHLEELVSKKTENIKRQNERLLKYSYANAHHVRGSVARILGLIQISRLKTDLDYPWFFEKVEQETTQVDEIIKGIARDLDTMDQ